MKTYRKLLSMRLAWMKQRCYNPKATGYKWYGGQGITICKEWLENTDTFITWALANGFKPELTIDRIDGTKGYYPDNCKWVTRTEQSINTKLIRQNNTTGYRGVHYNKNEKMYTSYITINKKRKHLGRYKTALEAAKVHDTYIIENNLQTPLNNVIKNTTDLLQPSMFKEKQSNNTSGYSGVHYSKLYCIWVTIVKSKGKIVFRKSCSTAYQCALLREKYLLENLITHPRLKFNFITLTLREINNELCKFAA